ncbi:MAG TPA: hypothetical protein VFG30_22405 [Polyangiales bacterium]|nr:hypothetical protein [Polyangiales bacterium]
MSEQRQRPASDDWRRNGQEEHLLGRRLFFKQYRRYSETWEHDHCEFCNAKFSENDGDLHEGYTTEDNYYWISTDCFEDFKDEFQWKVDE